MNASAYPWRAAARQGMALSMACGLAIGCQQTASDLQIERLPAVNPSLPPVPTLPPPPFEVQYDDDSYSVYGVRRRRTTTMDQEVSITGYIVEVYEAPECEAGQTCDPPAAPHVWLADVREPEDDADADARLMVAGYAERQEQIDRARRSGRRGRNGQAPIPTDFDVGRRVKVSGKFTRVSGAGFNVSNGLLEYQGHETLSDS